MNWKQLHEEMNAFEREVFPPQQPARDWRTLKANQRIAARIKPWMDGVEVDEIVNQEYKREDALEEA